MAISPEQVQRFKVWIHEKGLEMKCPWCGHTELDVADLIAGLTLTGNAVTQDPMIPLVPLVCTRCTHTSFFSAIASGVYQVQKPGFLSSFPLNPLRYVWQ